MVPNKWTWQWLRRSGTPLLALTIIFSFLSSAYAQYFVINQPSASTAWVNGSPYPFSWSKGLLDGIDTFDVELTRLNEDGLWYVAKNVPTTYNTLNILLQDVPAGDDYFLICLNSTHSVIYSVSSRFIITNSSSVQSNPSPDAAAPTVTVSGGPDPLKQFAATLGPASNGGGSLILGGESLNTRALSVGGVIVLCIAFLGGVMVLW